MSAGFDKQYGPTSRPTGHGLLQLVHCRRCLASILTFQVSIASEIDKLPLLKEGEKSTCYKAGSRPEGWMCCPKLPNRLPKHRTLQHAAAAAVHATALHS